MAAERSPCHIVVQQRKKHIYPIVAVGSAKVIRTHIYLKISIHGLRIKHVDKATIKQRVSSVMEIVGLTKYANYYPRQLSASMLQRVVIARAFAVEPELLLMDEPYGQLDLQLKYHLEDELISLWEKTGTTIRHHR